MGNVAVLLHDPATLISIGAGFFVLMVVILIFVLKSKFKQATETSETAAATEAAAEEEVSDGSLSFLYSGTGGSVDAGNSSSAKTPTKIPLYNAMVFTEEGIKFPAIKQNPDPRQKLVNTIYCDPTMPKSGSKLLCIQKADGTYVGYDPREMKINSKDTAQRAWRATHCLDIVKDMFSAPLSGLEKLNQIFMWVFCGGLLFLGIIALSRI